MKAPGRTIIITITKRRLCKRVMPELHLSGWVFNQMGPRRKEERGMTAKQSTQARLRGETQHKVCAATIILGLPRLPS